MAFYSHMLMTATHNSGQWTKARFHSFIKGGLRGVSGRWPPKHTVKKRAWVERGIYLCAGHNKPAHEVPLTAKKVPGHRVNNVFVDHIEPVVGPEGFIDWDTLIERMFCEIDGLQLLCKDCHDKKTSEERQQRKEYGTNNKST